MLDFGFYNLDCMVGMKEFPDKYFDLAIVDPPYGLGENPYRSKTRTKLAKTTEWGDFYKTWDDKCPEQDYFDELFRVSKNQIIWGANHMMHRIMKPSPCWIVWDKDNTGCFADAELAWTSFSTAVRIFRYRWNGMIQENMKNKEIRINPCQKPVALYEWTLKNYAGGVISILDTHVGSASSLIACHNMGYKCVGFENDKRMFKKASDRLAAVKAQHDIFEYIER